MNIQPKADLPYCCALNWISCFDLIVCVFSWQRVCYFHQVSKEVQIQKRLRATLGRNYAKYTYIHTPFNVGFCGGSAVKNPLPMQEIRVQSQCQEDSRGEGNGSPLQYSCLENSTDRAVRWATVHRVSWGHKESDIIERLFIVFNYNIKQETERKGWKNYLKYGIWNNRQLGE